MSYIDKNSDIVVSARLTDRGRRLLANGALTFNSFKLGDSEIDYSTLGATYDVTLENIEKSFLRKCEKQEIIAMWVTKKVQTDDKKDDFIIEYLNV